MIEVKEKTIDGHDFKFHPMMATPARELLDKLIRMFGPSIAAAVEGLDSAEVDTNMEITSILGSAMGSIGGSLREIAAAMQPAFHHKLVEELGSHTQWRNEDGNYVPLRKDLREVLFATNLLTEFKWIAFCLEVQFSDFFGLFQTLAGQAVALRAMANESKSRSQKVSTGTYKESPPTNAIAAD
jgi:hypothetical protein